MTMDDGEEGSWEIVRSLDGAARSGIGEGGKRVRGWNGDGDGDGSPRWKEGLFNRCCGCRCWLLVCLWVGGMAEEGANIRSYLHKQSW